MPLDQKVQAWVRRTALAGGSIGRRGWQVSPSSCNFLLVQRGHHWKLAPATRAATPHLGARLPQLYRPDELVALALLDRRRNRRLLRALDQVQATDRA